MELFVSGRVCLFGEHSDWAGGYRRQRPQLTRGYTLIAGTDQGVFARVQPAKSSLQMSAVLPNGVRQGPVEFPLEPDLLLETARQGGFWSYVAGVAFQAVTLFQVGGLVMENYRTDLPRAKRAFFQRGHLCVGGACFQPSV